MSASRALRDGPVFGAGRRGDGFTEVGGGALIILAGTDDQQALPGLLGQWQLPYGRVLAGDVARLFELLDQPSKSLIRWRVDSGQSPFSGRPITRQSAFVALMSLLVRVTFMATFLE